MKFSKKKNSSWRKKKKKIQVGDIKNQVSEKKKKKIPSWRNKISS
jgi:hypothetical protein